MTPDPSCPMPEGDGVGGDPEILAQGWTRRFLAEGARVEEATQLYLSMGLDVRAEVPSPAELGPSCAGCAEALCRAYRMIYTRKRNP